MKTLPARLPVFLLASMMATAATAAGAAAESARGLADLSLEELMNESITSVGKKSQRIGQAAAAIYVLTAEDIRRAGHTSIPEALRMVPGLSVAHLDSHTWVVTARGFAAQWAGKLLVLVDGRTVYDPFYAGVVWVVQDLMIEDLDRIEVIRGPGATLWGVNAVNGVINIITKKATETQGGLAAAGGGTQAHTGSLRYGGEAGRTHYRAYARYTAATDFIDADGRDAEDSWGMRRAGFRADWQASDSRLFTLQGDVYSGEQNTIGVLTSLTPPSTSPLPHEQSLSGANVLARWTATRNERSSLSLQLYFDRNENQNPMLSSKRDIFDVEFQHQLDVGFRHAVVYGGGFRLLQTDYEDSFFLPYPEDHDAHRQANAFLQDEVALIDQKLALTVGAKFEHNDDTGLAFQPNARLLWTPRVGHSIWGSISRADRTPTRRELDLQVNYAVFDEDDAGPMPPTVLGILPNRELDTEELIAYEAGYRLQSGTNLYLDFAGFLNAYERLIATENTGGSFETTPAPHVLVADLNVNSAGGKTYGIEFGPSWQVTESWKLAGGYTWLHMRLESPGEAQEGDSPRHQFHVRSFMQWPHKVSFDTALYYVDDLPNQGVPSYLRLDARVGWQPTEQLDLSLSGTNLFDSQHPEFPDVSMRLTEVRRSVYGKLTWRF